MNYKGKGTVVSLFLTPYVKKFYKLKYPYKNSKAFVKNVKKEYKAIILRTPGIGGKALEFNLYFAGYVFAIHKADPDGMSPQVIDELVQYVFDSKFMINAHKNKKCTLFSDKVQDEKVKGAMESQISSYEMDWKYEYVKGKDEFYCTYTECGICKMGERESERDVVPCVCKMDYRNYENDGAILYRTKTIGGGDSVCDFHVVRK